MTCHVPELSTMRVGVVNNNMRRPRRPSAPLAAAIKAEQALATALPKTKRLTGNTVPKAGAGHAAPTTRLQTRSSANAVELAWDKPGVRFRRTRERQQVSSVIECLYSTCLL